MKSFYLVSVRHARGYRSNLFGFACTFAGYFKANFRAGKEHMNAVSIAGGSRDNRQRPLKPLIKAFQQLHTMHMLTHNLMPMMTSRHE